jgi:hypothetical protein
MLNRNNITYVLFFISLLLSITLICISCEKTPSEVMQSETTPVYKDYNAHKDDITISVKSVEILEDNIFIQVLFEDKETTDYYFEIQNYDFYNGDKCYPWGDGTQMGINVIDKTSFGDFHLAIKKGEVIPESVNLVIKKIKVVPIDDLDEKYAQDVTND